MGTAHGSMPAGLRLIVGYKFLKGVAELLAGATFFMFGSAALASKLSHVAQVIRHHATEAWSIALAEKLLDESTAHHVAVVAMAMLVDGIVTSVEGWALYRRYVWSRWLVVGTTASLLPFEVIALVHHPNYGHAGILLVNLIIVVYLLRRHEDAVAVAGSPQAR